MFARLIAVVIVLAASGAEAQTASNILDGVVKVNLRMEDRVKNGCWLSPNETRKQIELELVRSKVKTEKAFRPPAIFFNVRGHELETVDDQKTGNCAVTFDFSFQDCSHISTSYSRAKKFSCFTIWYRTGVTVGPKDKMQSIIDSNAVKLAREFLYDLEMDRLGKEKK